MAAYPTGSESLVLTQEGPLNLQSPHLPLAQPPATPTHMPCESSATPFTTASSHAEGLATLHQCVPRDLPTRARVAHGLPVTRGNISRSQLHGSGCSLRRRRAWVLLLCCSQLRGLSTLDNLNVLS